MKRRSKTIGLIAAYIAGFVLLITYITVYTREQSKTDCKTTGQTIPVSIENQTFVPQNISAHKCDVLEVQNNNHASAIPALGPHDHHADYPGYVEKILKPGDTMTLKLTKTGNYTIHDHLHEDIEGNVDIQ